ncbi:hypothetical protein QOZ80_9AG0689060 [Eleusine coracana subsp. coracana]|nr:hypothetical protein QOZ80_9AG0689060 [Eleusine coracana subsp. coracana]
MNTYAWSSSPNTSQQTAPPPPPLGAGVEVVAGPEDDLRLRHRHSSCPRQKALVLEAGTSSRHRPPRQRRSLSRTSSFSGKRMAYGCGTHGLKILDDLTIYVRLVEPGNVTSALYIHMGDLAHLGIQAEFGTLDGQDLTALMVSSGLQSTVRARSRLSRCAMALAITSWSSWRRSKCLSCRRKSSVPPSNRCSTCGHRHRSHRFLPEGLASESEGQWRVHGMHFDKEIRDDFFVEAMFSSQGKVFFVDLAKGLVHGYLPLPTADNDSDVDFSVIPLPEEARCERWASNNLEEMGDLNHKRTMNCVQGYIRLVCIDDQHPNMKVTVWTLDLPSKQWTKDKEFLAGTLWNQGLSKTEPMWPVLMTDGTLSLLLPNLRQKKEDSLDDYICNLDYLSLKFNWRARLNGYTYREPVILPSGFFTRLIRPSDGTPMVDIFMDRWTGKNK